MYLSAISASVKTSVLTSSKVLSRTHAIILFVFNIFAATLHICRPFLHYQCDEAPSRGDKERYTTDAVNKENDGVP